MGLGTSYTEAVALIATQILEFVRDGDKSVTELMDVGKQLLGRRQVLSSVPYLLDSVQCLLMRNPKWMIKLFPMK
ncbi:urease-like [Hibiscus syriacus]|uniref:urease-like n=1 Tax=Hibiscus syriacus TaxID=106335 RepID=UPI00192356F0|nr:urease-like [Hibiscus syriacus]